MRLFTLVGVCGLEVKVGGGRIRSACGVVDTNKNGTRMQGYVVGEAKKKWTICLLSNDLVLLDKPHYREFVEGKK